MTALEYRLRGRLDQPTLDRFDRLRQPVDRVRSMLGRLLLRHGLLLHHGLRRCGAGDAASVVIGPYGKPRLAHGPVEFNLSHAGRWVVCALSSMAVGVDVEQLRPFNLQLAWRYFHQRECAALAALPVAAQHAYFFRLWTAKEAYMKALGLGFQREMASFSVAPGAGPDVALDDPQLSPQPYLLSHLDLAPGYQLALCRTRQQASAQLRHVALEDLLALSMLQ